MNGAGDVIAVGSLTAFDFVSSFYVIKLDGSTGETMFTLSRFGDGSHSSAKAVTVDAVGDVIASGIIDNESVGIGTPWNDFYVVKLPEPSGAMLCLCAVAVLAALRRSRPNRATSAGSPPGT